MAPSLDRLKRCFLQLFFLSIVWSFAEEANTGVFQENTDDNDSDERSMLRREEVKLEREIIQRIESGDWESLDPNSGRAVEIRGHSIFVRFEEEDGSEYRVWDWQGHLGLFHPENGFFRELTYGHFYEPLPYGEEDAEGEHPAAEDS